MSDFEMFFAVEKVTTEVTVYTAGMSWYTIRVVSEKEKDHALLNEHVVETKVESNLSGSTPAELRMYADAADRIARNIEWGYLDEPTESTPVVESAPHPAHDPLIPDF